MAEVPVAEAVSIPAFLIEYLVWNAPNYCFSGDSWEQRIQGVLCHLWSKKKEDSTCKEWCEVNDIKHLFHGSQKCSREQAHAFISAVWDYVGVKS